jgi:A118 family predicted phage portal protein
MPFANNIDPTSPLGVSAYARAEDLMRRADELYSNLVWEFDSGKRAIYVDSHAFGKDTNGKDVIPNRRLYRELDSAGNIGDAKKRFDDWTPEFREASILSGLDAILKKVEFNCGLAQGTISDPSTVALTATEIKASKQRTYATIVDTQKALQDALDDLTYAMDVWTTIGNLAPRGDYSAVYYFDDSIVADHDTAFSQDMQVLDRVMSKVEFRMRNYGEDEATARKMVAMVTAEQRPVDFFPATE